MPAKTKIKNLTWVTMNKCWKVWIMCLEGFTVVNPIPHLCGKFGLNSSRHIFRFKLLCLWSEWAVDRKKNSSLINSHQQKESDEWCHVGLLCLSFPHGKDCQNSFTFLEKLCCIYTRPCSVAIILIILSDWFEWYLSRTNLIAYQLYNDHKVSKNTAMSHLVLSVGS